ncbi:hypothetical protein BJY52DRAFT_1400112 [Lactarius psammicola]|nr:hypothetical protein BJY52DRAFT_1400112 [Lactarius psammicola]
MFSGIVGPAVPQERQWSGPGSQLTSSFSRSNCEDAKIPQVGKGYTSWFDILSPTDKMKTLSKVFESNRSSLSRQRISRSVQSNTSRAVKHLPFHRTPHSQNVRRRIKQLNDYTSATAVPAPGAHARGAARMFGRFVRASLLPPRPYVRAPRKLKWALALSTVRSRSSSRLRRKPAVVQRTTEQAETLRRLTKANATLSARALPARGGRGSSARGASYGQPRVGAQAGAAARPARGDQPRANRKQESMPAAIAILVASMGGQGIISP